MQFGDHNDRREIKEAEKLIQLGNDSNIMIHKKATMSNTSGDKKQKLIKNMT